MSLDETELNFQANVDPYLFGNATLSISPENHISVEEAFIQTTSLPAGFTLRAGRFFSGIGYLNEQHSHTWDFADQALPYRVFLNTQYDDDGVQLRWLAPTAQFLELGGELFRGAAFPASGPARVGFGCKGRCEPAWGLAFGFGSLSPLALCPWLGGTEELSGVLGGRFSRSRGAAFSAISASTRANSVRISASFSADDREEKSGGGAIES